MNQRKPKTTERPQTSVKTEKSLLPQLLYAPNQRPMKCLCCLFYMDFMDVETKQRVPLKSLNYEVEIVDCLAYISINQEYFNDDPIRTIETDFLFSIANEACFYDFEARIGDIVIKGAIKEKKIAKAEYQDNLRKGNMVAYSEISSEQQDLVKIKVGNIPPQSSVSIKFKYIQQLEICLNKFWRLTIPSTLTPRYQSRHHYSQDNEVKALENTEQIKPTDQIKKYPWTIKTVITSSSPISFLKSPSHSIVSEYDKTQSKCTLSFQNEEVPNKDFTILFKNDALNKPNWILEQRDQDEDYPYCAMVSFFPHFNPAPEDEAYDSYVKNSAKNDFKISALKSKGEFLFVLDQSGSMKGGRIEMAKESLILFLKSMPPDSYFNIVSFGSRYRSMFHKESSKYSEEKIDNAIKEIQRFQADLGGTELFDPLRELFNSRHIKNYPRNVFVLTDGAISNTNKVLELIAKYNDDGRVYMIGIGNGCSRELIIEGAKAGKGRHEFIGDGEDMNAKILGLLQDSLTPFLTDIKLEYDEKVVEMITPLPESVTFVRKNEALNFFVFFNKGFAETNQSLLKLSFVDSLKKERQNEVIDVQVNDLILREDLLHRYGAFKSIKTASRSITYERNYNKDIFIAKKHDIDDFCLNLSLKYQILTTFTAFICVIQERDIKDPLVLLQKKIEIPSIISIDHSDLYNNNPQQPIAKPQLRMKCIEKATISATSHMETLSSLKHPNARYMESKIMAPASSSMKKESVKEEKIKEEKLWKNKKGAAKKEKKEEKKAEGIAKKEECEEEEEISLNLLEEEKEKGKTMEIGGDKDFEESKVEKLEKKEEKIEKPENKEHLMKILTKIKSSGYWEVSKDLISLLGVTEEQIFERMPKEIEKKEVWLTVVILAFLEGKFPKSKGTWDLISQKAVEYLEDKEINLAANKLIALEILN